MMMMEIDGEINHFENCDLDASAGKSPKTYYETFCSDHLILENEKDIGEFNLVEEKIPKVPSPGSFISFEEFDLALFENLSVEDVQNIPNDTSEDLSERLNQFISDTKVDELVKSVRAINFHNGAKVAKRRDERPHDKAIRKLFSKTASHKTPSSSTSQKERLHEIIRSGRGRPPKKEEDYDEEMEKKPELRDQIQSRKGAKKYRDRKVNRIKETEKNCEELKDERNELRIKHLKNKIYIDRLKQLVRSKF